MSLTRRSVFFWSLVILCLGTIALIVFFSLGYRYNFSRGIFIYTGSITLKSNPRTVSLTLDDTDATAEAGAINGSYHVGGVRPGPHHIAVSAPGFRSWSKEVLITSGISTEFWNILLLRDTYPFRTYAVPDTIQHLYPAPDKTLFAYVTRSGDESTVHTFDTSTGQDIQIFSSSDHIIDTNNHENIEWSPRSDALIIPTTTRSGTHEYFVVTRDTLATSNLKDITPLRDPRDVRWNPSADRSLCFLDADALHEITLDTTTVKILTDGIRAYDFSGTTAFTLDSAGFVWNFPLNAPKNRSQVTTLPVPDTLVQSHPSLVIYDVDRLFVIDYTRGALALYNHDTNGQRFESLSDQARGAQFSNDGKKLLFWTDHEVRVRFTRSWEVQPPRAENQTIEIARYIQTLQNVQWIKNYEHVLIDTGHGLDVTELDARNRITQTLTTDTTTPFLQILSDFPQNRLYFIRPTTDNATKNTLTSIDFPEPTTLFGIINR